MHGPPLVVQELGGEPCAIFEVDGLTYVATQRIDHNISVGTRFAMRQLKAQSVAMGLGCVKTPKWNLRVEISSRFRQFENQQRWRLHWEKTIEKTILRLPLARTFPHSLGQSLPKRDVRCHVRFFRKRTFAGVIGLSAKGQ